MNKIIMVYQQKLSFAIHRDNFYITKRKTMEVSCWLVGHSYRYFKNSTVW